MLLDQNKTRNFSLFRMATIKKIISFDTFMSTPYNIPIVSKFPVIPKNEKIDAITAAVTHIK